MLNPPNCISDPILSKYLMISFNSGCKPDIIYHHLLGHFKTSFYNIYNKLHNPSAREVPGTKESNMKNKDHLITD